MDMIDLLAPLGILLGMVLLALSVFNSYYLLKIIEELKELQQQTEGGRSRSGGGRSEEVRKTRPADPPSMGQESR